MQIRKPKKFCSEFKRLCSVLGVLNVPKFDANVLFVPNCKVLFDLFECIIASLLQVLGNSKNVRARSKISEFSKKSSPPSNGFKYPRLIEGQEQKKIKFLKATFYVGRPLHGEQNNSLISSVFQTVFLCVFLYEFNLPLMFFFASYKWSSDCGVLLRTGA